MKVGFWPLLSLMALPLVALAACARGNPPQGVGTNPGGAAPTSTTQSGPGSSPAPGPRTPESHCPRETPLDPGGGPKDAAVAGAEPAGPHRHPPPIHPAGVAVTEASTADPASLQC